MSESGGSILDHNQDQSESALYGLFFVAIALFLGIFTRSALAWTKLPFTALLLVWGVLLGIGNETYTKNWDYVGPGIAVWEDIEPNFFLALLLPLIIYSAAIAMHWHTLRRCMFQVLLLAGPGVVLGTALTAVFVKYAFPYNWTWLESLLFGAMLSATDPVAVIALLQEVGADKELRTVIEGESLFNDGSAYVLFLLFHNALNGQQLTPGYVIKQLCQLSIGGPAVGIAFGLVMVIWLRFIYNQDVVEVTMTIVAALGCFIVSNEILGVSGVLAVLCLGIWMAAFGSHHISRQVQEPLHIIWEELEFIANTLIFVLAGVIIAGNIYQSEHSSASPFEIKGRDYGYAVLLWVVLLCVRAVIFMVCYPVLKVTGYGITFRKAIIMVWAGLRGAVGLALSLFVLFDGQISDRSFRLLAFFFMGLISAITICVQGSTTGILLQALGLTRRLSAKRTFLNNVMHQVERYGDAHAKMVEHSDVLGPPNWKDISALASLNAKQLLTRYASVHNMRRPFPYWDPAGDVELEASQRHITAEHKAAQVRQETRARLLRAVQQTYEDVFERAQIAPAHMYKLRKSANRALDHTDQPVCDWRYLDEACQLPAWLHVLQRLRVLPFTARFCRQQLFQYLEHSASLMVTFHYAHTDAAQSMLHFDLLLEQDLHSDEVNDRGTPNAGAVDTAKAQIIKEVIEESKDELLKAERYLLSLRNAYPEILASIRTKQVAQEMLLVKEAYIHELKASGLMDEAELEEVIHLVDRQKKKLHFADSLMHVQSAHKELQQLPLFQGLSDADFARVTSAARLRLFGEGTAVQSKHDSCLLFILRGAVTIQTSHAQHHAQDQHQISRHDHTSQAKDQLDQRKISKPDKADLIRDQPDQQKISRSDQPDHFISQLADTTQSPHMLDHSTHLADRNSAEPLHLQDTHSSQMLGQCNGEGQQHEPADQSGMQDSWTDKQVLDARGLALGLPGAMQQAPFDIQAAANTVVEAFEVPWACMQSLGSTNEAMQVRMLQLCAAQVAMLHGGPLLTHPPWTPLQRIFRKAKLQDLSQGQRAQLHGPCFLFSGQLQLSNGCSISTHAPALHTSSSAKGVQSLMRGSAMPGSNLPSPERAPLPPLRGSPPSEEEDVMGQANVSNGRSDEGSEVEDDSCCLQAPFSFSFTNAHVICLQHAQIFHLPIDLLHQASDTPADSDNDASAEDERPQVSIQQHLDISNTEEAARAVDTGHWGKKLHEPSAFLSHDLWSKLGDGRALP